MSTRSHRRCPESGARDSGYVALAPEGTSSPVPVVGIIEPLRGLAAFAVAWFHFTNGAGLLREGWLKSSGKYGWLGVEVFFVISGFIIPYSLYRAGYRFPEHMGRFILKRIIRLDPPYIVAIVATISLGYLSAASPWFRGSPPQIEWITLALHLGYLNAFFGFPWVIPAFWTLAIEFQFYLLISITFPVLASTSRLSRTMMLALFLGLPFLIPAETIVFRHLGLFALGIVTFQKHCGLISRRAFFVYLPIAALVAALSLGAMGAIAGLMAAWAIAFLKIPSWTPLTWLGVVSYSLYLLHVPIGGRAVNLGSRWAHDTPSQVVVLLLAVAVSLAASYLMYRLVEVPAKRFSSSLRYGRKSERAGQAVPSATDLSDS